MVYARIDSAVFTARGGTRGRNAENIFTRKYTNTHAHAFVTGVA